MKVYGIDFTSSPSALNSKSKTAKWMTLARCTLDHSCLTVDSLELLNGKPKDDYSALISLLSSTGPWIAGIDVPFGMPIECIEYFHWLERDDFAQDWETYIGRCRQISNRKEFKALIEGWRHPMKTNGDGERERVRKYRLVDKLIGAQSPMNCIRPAVGSMFYEASAIIKNSPASIPPVRYRENEQRSIVEAYPRLVVDRLVGSTNYKEADGLESVRCLIFKYLTDPDKESLINKSYDAHVRISQALMEECVQDRAGDKLDSVLSAVQAAWAFRQNNCGMPLFTTSAMRCVLALEGWVADPLPNKWSSRNELVLDLGVEGGEAKVYRSRLAAGCWQFHQEGGSMDLGGEGGHTWRTESLPTLEQALLSIAKDGSWVTYYPSYIHPEYQTLIWELAQDAARKLPEHLMEGWKYQSQNWQRLLATD